MKCLCCEKEQDASSEPIDSKRICPECGHVFKGNGWDGIDAHWRAKHEKLMKYEDFWGSLCIKHKGSSRS